MEAEKKLGLAVIEGKLRTEGNGRRVVGGIATVGLFVGSLAACSTVYSIKPVEALNGTVENVYAQRVPRDVVKNGVGGAIQTTNYYFTLNYEGSKPRLKPYPFLTTIFQIVTNNYNGPKLELPSSYDNLLEQRGSKSGQFIEFFAKNGNEYSVLQDGKNEIRAKEQAKLELYKNSIGRVIPIRE